MYLNNIMDFNDLLGELRSRFNVDDFTEASGKEGKGVKDDDIFWVDAVHQMYVERHSKGRDDLLFFVKWDAKQNCEQVEVFRKDAISLPSARDESVLWKQTLYLNFILHEESFYVLYHCNTLRWSSILTIPRFEYYVTCGVITVMPGSDNIDKVKVKVEQQVYASPSQRRMDKKGSVSDVVYPNIMFCVDNFEDIFSTIYSTAPGEKIAVQLLAANKTASLNQLAFLGAIDHTKLEDAYDYREQTKPTGLSSKLRRFSLKSRNSRVFDLTIPYHFLRMRGPSKKGFAEVAIRKQELPLAELQTYKQFSSPSSTNSETTRTSSEHFYGLSKTDQAASNGVTDQASQASVSSPGESSNGCLTQGSWVKDSDDWLNVVQDKTRTSSEVRQGTDEVLDSRYRDQLSVEECSNRDGIATTNSTSNGCSSLEAKDTTGGLKAKLKSLRQLPRKYKHSEGDSSNSPRMYGYLTYVQLPWYTLVDDILNSNKDQAI